MPWMATDGCDQTAAPGVGAAAARGQVLLVWSFAVSTMSGATRWGPAEVFGAGTVFLAIAVSVPQFVRLWRGDTAAGVSLPAVLNSAISFLAWTVYALCLGDGWLIASSAIGLPFAIVTALAAWRCGADRGGLWLPLLWACVLIGTCVLGGTTAKVVVGASIGWFVVPAAAKAWLSRDVSGIAVGSWLTVALEGALFLGYGVVQGVGATVVYGVVAVLGSAAVMARLVSAVT